MNKMDLETWRQQEADLATLRAELDAKTAEAVRLREAALDVVTVHADVVGDNPGGAIGRLHAALSSMPATQKEVERVRAMERIAEAAKEVRAWGVAFSDSRLEYDEVQVTKAAVKELDDALAAYEHLSDKR